MEHNKNCDSSGKNYRSSESTNVPFNLNKHIVVRITNTTESPHSSKKNTHFAEFWVVTPEHSKFIKTVETATLSLIPERDFYLTTYLNELSGAIKPEQQNNTFWFPTPENSDKIQDPTLYRREPQRTS